MIILQVIYSLDSYFFLKNVIKQGNVVLIINNLYSTFQHIVMKCFTTAK